MKRGFTLIEVLVTMAIILVLAGMMVPAAWKWWESQEVSTTRDRINSLKLAMVGDRSQIQNGIRTSYGFVGDYGELPVQDQLSTVPLRKYIPGGYHSDAYNDAWGRRFRYTAYDNLPGYGGRFLSGQVCSDGVDGAQGTTDDICVEIPLSEVAPTDRIQGNFIFSGEMAAYSSARFEVTFKNPTEPGGESTMSSGCKSRNATAFPNFTTIFTTPASPLNLPIGKVTIRAWAYTDTSCSAAAPAHSGFMDFFVSDNLSRMLLILPPIP